MSYPEEVVEDEPHEWWSREQIPPWIKEFVSGKLAEYRAKVADDS